MKRYSFIFISKSNEEGSLALLGEEDLTIVHPLAHYSWETLQQWQQESELIIVLPSAHFSFYSVNLPQLTEKQIRASLPFLLEEELCAPPSELHFSYDPSFYQNGAYFVAVCNCSYIESILEDLKKREIACTRAAVECFALKPQEMWINEEGLILNQYPNFMGLVSAAALALQPQLMKETELKIFLESKPELIPPDAAKPTLSLYEEMGKRLMHAPFINIFQDVMAESSPALFSKSWLITLTSMGLILIVSFFAIQAWILYELNASIKKTDKQIAGLYQQFFPNSHQIINPRFRVQQLLKSREEKGSNGLWIMLTALAKIHNETLLIQSLRYQNNKLQVAIVSKSIDTLAQLQNQLQKEHIQVKQINASSAPDGMHSLLELWI